MQNISQGFSEAQNAPLRQTTAQVTLEMVDNSAYFKRTIQSSEESSISNVEQLTNKIRRTDYNFATLEPDFFQLDGRFALVDDSINQNETGFISQALCNEDGWFSNPITVTFEFEEYINSPGLTITFDTKLNQYARDFSFSYSNNSNLVYTEKVENNDKAVFVSERVTEQYNRFVLTINRWGTGCRRARIVEVDFGLLKTFTGSELIKIDVIEELDTINNVVATNELSFTLDNSDRQFNVLNPNGIYRFLKNRQEITCEFGVKVGQNFEYVQMGKFYLEEWKADEGALSVSFTAYDVTKSLEGEMYENELNTTTTAYELCENILTKCGIKKYFIDQTLKSIKINQKSDSITCKEALQMIGIAASSVVYQSRNGELRIEPLETIFKRERYLLYVGDNQAITGVSVPEIDNEAYSKTISLDNAYKVPQISLSTPVETVEITYRVGEEDKTYILSNSKTRAFSQLQVDNRTAVLSNPFIASEDEAKKVAQWILNELAMSAEYEVSWRGNPAFECGDTIFIEDGFKTIFQSRIIKQTYNYTGFLKGVTITKGSV